MSEESKKYGAQGGKKRAANLTKAQRSNSASMAATVRWHKDLPEATHGSPDKPLILGGMEIPCYVLNDGRRVLVQRGLQTGIGMSTSGGTGGAHRTARFIASLEAKGVKTNNLSVRISDPIVFKIPGLPKPAYGYEASVVPEICSAIVDADKKGDVLLAPQRKYAAQCELLVRALADKGITALVDEVTGFKEFSEQIEIASFLTQYITDERRQWASTFPRTFFEQICRLKNVPFPKQDMRLPQYFGGIVNDLVWSRIAPGVLAELRNVNPVVGPKGRRKSKHHQHMTKAIGNPKLLHLIGQLEGIAAMFDAGDYDAFKKMVDRVIKNYGTDALKTAEDIPKIAGRAANSLRLKAPSAPLPELFSDAS